MLCRQGEQVSLLVLRHRYGGTWSFPKGHMEGRETEVQTALREVREERAVHPPAPGVSGERNLLSQAQCEKTGGVFFRSCPLRRPGTVPGGGDQRNQMGRSLPGPGGCNFPQR
ncbi:MAG: NUDIX domain-containing protein [Oscillospiraceae bacterium]